MATRNAQVDESVSLITARGRAFTTEVMASCGGKDGHWACASHPREHIANNISMSSHVEGPGNHVEVWICHEHGPETP